MNIDDKFEIIGVHVGSSDGRSYATMISKLMLLDFIIPAIEEFEIEFHTSDYDHSYQLVIQELRDKFRNEMQKRDEVREAILRNRTIILVKNNPGLLTTGEKEILNIEMDTYFAEFQEIVEN